MSYCSTVGQPIITNQEFRARFVLRRSTCPGADAEQFTINDAATVQYRIKSADGKTAFFPWRTMTKDSNRDDNWSLSTLDVIVDAADTGLVKGSTAVLDIRVQGSFVERDGTVTSETYDQTWSTLYAVEVGLA